MPEPAIPIVPLHVNVYLPPQPTPQRCYGWGKVLGEILRARPERLVLMGVGWDVALPRHRPVRVARVRLRPARRAGGRRGMAAGGSHRRAARQDGQHRAPHVGHAAAWATLLGAIGDAKADVYCYEPSWHHGNAVVEWPV